MFTCNCFFKPAAKIHSEPYTVNLHSLYQQLPIQLGNILARYPEPRTGPAGQTLIRITYILNNLKPYSLANLNKLLRNIAAVIEQNAHQALAQDLDTLVRVEFPHYQRPSAYQSLCMSSLGRRAQLKDFVLAQCSVSASQATAKQSYTTTSIMTLNTESNSNSKITP